VSKPKIFIASSVESLPIAEAVNLNLDHDFEVTLWRTGTFKLSSGTLEDLLVKASTVDFALFVFAPEDIAVIRENTHHVTRDNVVFELGLFIGSIGKERCFVLRPRNEELHLPSDLIGLNFADFDANRADGDIASATNAACTQIKTRANELGRILGSPSPSQRRLTPNPPEYTLDDIDFDFLASCLESHTNLPGGMAFYRVKSNMSSSCPDSLLRIAAIKLERMNLVEKVILTDDQDGYDFYSYSITDQGIDLILKNGERLSSGPDDDEVPF